MKSEFAASAIVEIQREMEPLKICSALSSSSSSLNSGSSGKAWIVHGLVAGVAVAVVIGAHRYGFLRLRKFRSRVVGIIPARLASSRFHAKPLVPILGKPMIQVWFGLYIFTFEYIVLGFSVLNFNVLRRTI